MNNLGKVFGQYSKYYNLLYHDKNYKSETEFVHQLIQKYRLKSIATYRKRGWITPVGKGLVPGVALGSNLYKPKQIIELRKRIILELFK